MCHSIQVRAFLDCWKQGMIDTKMLLSNKKWAKVFIAVKNFKGVKLPPKFEKKENRQIPKC